MHGTIQATDVVANMAEELGVDVVGVVEQMVADFAPRSSADRAERTAQMTGETIRMACAAAGKSVMDLAKEAEQLAAQCLVDAEKFAEAVKDIGDAHAKQIESALLGIKGTLATIGAERLRLAATANGAEQPAAETPKAA